MAKVLPSVLKVAKDTDAHPGMGEGRYLLVAGHAPQSYEPGAQ